MQLCICRIALINFRENEYFFDQSDPKFRKEKVYKLKLS